MPEDCKRQEGSAENDKDVMFGPIIRQWNVSRPRNRFAVKFHASDAAANAFGIFHSDVVSCRVIVKLN